VQAGDLRAGDVLLLKSGRRATISSLSVRQVRQKVYNIQMEEVHTYAVGTSEVLVHNKPMEYAPIPERPVGKLTKPDNKWFKDRGLNAEDLEREVGAAGKHDILKDRNGNLWIGKKDGSGEMQVNRKVGR